MSKEKTNSSVYDVNRTSSFKDADTSDPEEGRVNPLADSGIFTDDFQDVIAMALGEGEHSNVAEKLDAEAVHDEQTIPSTDDQNSDTGAPSRGENYPVFTGDPEVMASVIAGDREGIRVGGSEDEVSATEDVAGSGDDIPNSVDEVAGSEADDAGSGEGETSTNYITALGAILAENNPYYLAILDTVLAELAVNAGDPYDPAVVDDVIAGLTELEANRDDTGRSIDETGSVDVAGGGGAVLVVGGEDRTLTAYLAAKSAEAVLADDDKLGILAEVMARLVGNRDADSVDEVAGSEVEDANGVGGVLGHIDTPQAEVGYTGGDINATTGSADEVAAGSGDDAAEGGEVGTGASSHTLSLAIAEYRAAGSADEVADSEADDAGSVGEVYVPGGDRDDTQVRGSADEVAAGSEADATDSNVVDGGEAAGCCENGNPVVPRVFGVAQLVLMDIGSHAREHPNMALLTFSSGVAGLAWWWYNADGDYGAGPCS